MNGTTGVAVAVNRSTDGTTWDDSLVAANKGSNLDKDWIVCDNTAASPFYGHCYIEYDDNGASDLIYNSTSTDGGKTWSTPTPTADSARGLGGQPLVQADGTVIVPSGNAFTTAIIAYHSSDGGQTWSASTRVSGIQHHHVCPLADHGPRPYDVPTAPARLSSRPRRGHLWCCRCWLSRAA